MVQSTRKKHFTNSLQYPKKTTNTVKHSINSLQYPEKNHPTW
jgi:hypothetical protein